MHALLRLAPMTLLAAIAGEPAGKFVNTLGGGGGGEGGGGGGEGGREVQG